MQQSQDTQEHQANRHRLALWRHCSLTALAVVAAVISTPGLAAAAIHLSITPQPAPRSTRTVVVDLTTLVRSADLKTSPPSSTTPASSPPAPTTITRPAPAPKPTPTVSGVTTTTVPGSTTTTNPASSCKADPASAIAALPAGGVFNGSGCYSVPNGILITRSVTIDGGTYDDPSTTAPTVGHGVQPIIRIKDTANVTVENVKLVGANVGGYHATMVGEAGIDVLSSDHVTIANVTIMNTFGDGLTLFANFPRNKKPTTNLAVSNVTVTNSGREGITVADVSGGTFTNVNVVSSNFNSWDFESDLAGVGSGNVTVNSARTITGIRLIEALHGPITFNNCQCRRHVSLLYAAAASGQPVTFNGGTILLPNSDDGTSPAGITVNGPGNLTFTGVTLGRLPSVRPGTFPAWSVTDGGHLTLLHSPAAGSRGSHDISSTVTNTS